MTGSKSAGLAESGQVVPVQRYHRNVKPYRIRFEIDLQEVRRTPAALVAWSWHMGDLSSGIASCCHDATSR
jgi:hypothetical protein